MSSPDFTDQIIETDVLVIGGGAGGCFAAFAADDLGADVTIIEKAAIRRSGNLATGVDDARFAHPEITISVEEFARTIVEPMEGMVDPNLAYILARECYDRVRELERIGVKMREDDGTIKRFPKRHPAAVWFRGADLKLKMTDEVRRRKIRVIQYTMGTRLLVDRNRVVGAICLNIRDGKFMHIKAKATVLTTGGALRLYSVKGSPFLHHQCPACAGDGIAMAYHAGAELTGMEFQNISVGPSNPRIFSALGAVMDADVPVVDARRQPVAKAITKGANLAQIVLEQAKAGKGPLFWDFPAISEESRIQFARAAMNERPISLKYLKEEGIDLGKDRVEIAHLELEGIASHTGGILIDDECRASVEGLYAAGDEVALIGLRGNSALSAMTLGHRAGRFAAKHVKRIGHGNLNRQQFQEERQRLLAPLNRENGFEPLDLEEKVRNIMTDYCGIEKVGEKMERGLELLSRTRGKYLNQVSAKTPHQLMRFVELCSIFDIAEMHLKASLMRQESRLGLMHLRIDFPSRDDQNWKKLIIIRKLPGGNMNLETRNLPEKRERW